LVYRLVTGADEFWSNSYEFFYAVARNLVEGRGLAWSLPHIWTVQVPPAYPLLLAPAVLLGGNYLYIVIPQAVIGAGTALCAFLIGHELFGRRAGLTAAALTAIYPYYVVHDTALQETGLLAFCMALSVWLLLRARKSLRRRIWVIAGMALAISIMVRTTAAAPALLAIGWIAIFGTGTRGQRTARAMTLLACVGLIVAAWMVRNAQTIGRPVLSSGTGYSFWVAHNPQTFSHYPAGSIDRSAEESFAALPATDKKTVLGLADDNARDDWFLARGRSYVARQSIGTWLSEAARKVAAGFSWVLTPQRPGLPQWIYFLSYAPILLLGITGMWLTRQDWRLHCPVYLQFAAFTLVAAVMWAHTSHRAPLDVYLIIFAAAVLDRALPRLWNWTRMFYT
jgi:4-amino-4-deoxy-L-arabinose transferase-like glycosyltransferase